MTEQYIQSFLISAHAGLHPTESFYYMTIVQNTAVLTVCTTDVAHLVLCLEKQILFHNAFSVISLLNGYIHLNNMISKESILIPSYTLEHEEYNSNYIMQYKNIYR